MKKIFTLFLTLAALTAQANDYTDRILVLVNGEGTEQNATISVNEHDGLYDLNLKNFVLMNGDEPMPVGNVELLNITPETAGDAIFLRANQNISISEGDDENVLFWMGPSLGELPVEITAVLREGKLRAIIDLDLREIMQQLIHVTFGDELVRGTNYHVPNGDFEEWHTSKDSYVEPNAWHSFESATGDWASLAGHHIEKSDKGVDGSTCARIYATSIFGIVANGTMTTGRMNAGSMSAEDKKNNAYTDISKEDVDGNGDPFYVALQGRPDSLVLNLQFHQPSPNAQHPYATVSAVITDGTYYQDPEDKEYTNVVAKAQNNQIAVTGNDWQRIAIPFVYTDNTVEPKAILITISTNADAGQGGKDDEVLVDNLTLIYNSRLRALAVADFAPDKFEYEVETEAELENLAPVADGVGSYVLTAIKDTEEGKCAEVTVYAADLRSVSKYTVSCKAGDNKTTAIADAEASKAAPAAYYHINGTRAKDAQSGRVVIVKQNDGLTKKVIR